MARSKTENIPADVYIQFVRSLFDNAHMLLIGGACYCILGLMIFLRTQNPIYLVFSFVLLSISFWRYSGIRSFHRTGTVLTTVEEAQGTIVRTIRALEESGQIVVSRGSDEYVE